jgi:CRISPR-associated endonuclease/helicase Cas3
MFFAHSAQRREDWEPLQKHLGLVAARAAGFASAFDATDEGRLAGLLHDLGKYSELFTRRLEGRESGLDHWSIGARAALRSFGVRGIATALAVQGHHVGLQKGDRSSIESGLLVKTPLGVDDNGRRWTETDVELLLGRLRADRLNLPELAGTFLRHQPADGTAAFMLDVRMLFSCLTDADFLETEAHFNGEAVGRKVYRDDGQLLDSAAALGVLAQYVKHLEGHSTAAPVVLAVRKELFRACRAAGGKEQGLFTLTAPTGSGKTLAMLAFALEHAKAKGLRRVVYVAPYLTLIEQTVKVVRAAFGDRFGPEFILEDHSLAARPSDIDSDGTDSERRRRLLAQNWDAPIVVTTNVQMLESLLSNRPSACRKLHRLARSVILLDEVQTLPPELAVATLAALSALAGQRFRTSVVFSTATQPAFSHLHDAVAGLCAVGWQPIEIVAERDGLFQRLRRTVVRWRLDSPLPWAALAEELLSGNQSALCIVNLKRHAATLARLLLGRGSAEVLHLSTNMTPEHRIATLDRARALLKTRGVVLVSTQCVEAGVDIDFPVVYRALGPLDSVAQAAGRCNRHGSEHGSGYVGEVHVFLPEEEQYPPGAYQQASRATKTFLATLPGLPSTLETPALFENFYRFFFDLTRPHSDSRRGRDIREAIQNKDFPEVARLYKLIPDDTISVVMPYDIEKWAALRDEALSGFRSFSAFRQWAVRARPHSISLYRPKPQDSINGFLLTVPLPGAFARQPEGGEWFIYRREQEYDRQLLGFTGAPGTWIA